MRVEPARSSLAVNSRPIAGATPRTGRTSEVMVQPATRSGSLPATKLTSTAWYAPIAWKDVVIVFQSR